MTGRKALSLTLLAIGIVFCAAAGAQFGAQDYRTIADEGRSVLTSKTAPEIEASPEGTARVGEWFDKAGWLYLLGIAVLAAGAIMARAEKSAAERQGVDGQSGADATAEKLLERIRALQEDIERADSAVLRSRIDQVQQENLAPLIAASQRWRQADIDRYAAIVSALSAGERKLNRTWSALADGHRAEAVQSLEAAALQVETAQRLERIC